MKIVLMFIILIIGYCILDYIEKLLGCYSSENSKVADKREAREHQEKWIQEYWIPESKRNEPRIVDGENEYVFCGELNGRSVGEHFMVELLYSSKKLDIPFDYENIFIDYNNKHHIIKTEIPGRPILFIKDKQSGSIIIRCYVDKNTNYYVLNMYYHHDTKIISDNIVKTIYAPVRTYTSKFQGYSPSSDYQNVTFAQIYPIVDAILSYSLHGEFNHEVYEKPDNGIIGNITAAYSV